MPVKIKGIEGMTYEQVSDEIQRGGKFVVYSYCVSIVILTFRRSSDVEFVRSSENAVIKGLPWTLLSLCCGWWGFPWGLIYTPMALFTNLGGGKDVTNEVLSQLSPWAYASQNPLPQSVNTGAPRNPW